jgi:hypothetical protein
MASYAAYNLGEWIAAEGLFDVVIVRALTAPAGAGKRSIVQKACRSADAVSVRLSATDNKLLAAFAELCAHDVALFDPKKERRFHHNVGRGVTQELLLELCRDSARGAVFRIMELILERVKSLGALSAWGLSWSNAGNLLLRRRGPQEIGNR